ncbi:hypothetical protein AGR1B_pa0260 [Agrobacterium fabacearum S56]|nr:hypothetical protein AGR1B_pa0260 [Agrobacterium fabacearum S56]
MSATVAFPGPICSARRLTISPAIALAAGPEISGGALLVTTLSVSIDWHPDRRATSVQAAKKLRRRSKAREWERGMFITALPA